MVATATSQYHEYMYVLYVWVVCVSCAHSALTFRIRIRFDFVATAAVEVAVATVEQHQPFIQNTCDCVYFISICHSQNIIHTHSVSIKFVKRKTFIVLINNSHLFAFESAQFHFPFCVYLRSAIVLQFKIQSFSRRVFEQC